MKKTRTQSRAAAVALDNEPRPFTLAGRTALVTGSSRGLGKAIAFALGAAGAKVALNFANGLHPGGGFLRGSLAQEEVLCRSSALYLTLVGDPDLHIEHRRFLGDVGHAFS